MKKMLGGVAAAALVAGTKGSLPYMFYCICLEECDWISRQNARQLKATVEDLQAAAQLLK